MAIAIFPLVLAVIGALVFALSSSAPVKELGRITFAAGMFALAFTLANHTIHIG
jgi:hypothetical protein